MILASDYPLQEIWFLAMTGFLIGAVLGSFTTMLSYRLPRKISIVWPPSRCPSCQHVLGFLDLIPLLSWVMMRGKCRHCGVKIGARYVLIELFTTISIMLALLVFKISIFSLGAILCIVAGITTLTIVMEKPR